jgi:hypothetical protein
MPSRAPAAAASAISPSPPQAVAESTTWTRPGEHWAAAWRADSTVPEMPPDRWIDSTSRPWASSGS